MVTTQTRARRRSPRAWRSVALSVVLTAAGCGRPATVITGVVSLDGRPLQDAGLEFFPVSGKGRVSFARTDAEGRYRATVSPSPQKVIVTALKVDGKQRNPFDPDGPLIDRFVDALPPAYSHQEQTPLVAEPAEGQTKTIDLAITSDAR